MPPKVRKPETRLVAEYLAERVWPLPYKQRVPLGPPLPGLTEEHGEEMAIRMSRPFRLEVDAAYWTNDRLVLVEAKIFRLLDGLAKLPIYRGEVPLSPDLREHHGKRVEMELVAPWTSQDIERRAAAMGIHVVVFAPEWIAQVVADYHLYWTPEYRQARDEKIRLRQLLGVE